jgi:protein gp37
VARAKTGIEWTDRTWNPTTGCTKVSPGCKHCYAETVTKRFTNHFPDGFSFTLRPERLDQPRQWRQPSRIFVDSMSDLFHEAMPIEYLHRVFEVMEACPQHVFQVLTKRHKRLLELASDLTWPPNVWMGVSIENQRYVGRVEALRCVPAAVRFLSCEPLLGPLELDLAGIHWVIAGGESGVRHRPMRPDWVRAVRDQCIASGVPFLFKQWGGRTPKACGRHLDGELWDQYPVTPVAAQPRPAGVSASGVPSPSH